MNKANDIVYQNIIGGKEVVIRYLRKTDVVFLCNYINKLSKEKTYIAYQGEKISLEDEEKYVTNQLENIKKKKVVQLLLFVDGKLSGNTQIKLKERIEAHVGVLGISILKIHRGKGFGQLLLDVILNESQKKLSELKIVTLGVFPINKIAYKLYKKFGFKKYGRLPKGILYKGKYLDEILMYKNLNR